MTSRLSLLLILAVGACSAPASEPAEREPAPMRGVPQPSEQAIAGAAEDFEALSVSFLDWYYEAHPVRATELGLHTYDARLPELDRASIQRRIEALLDWDAELRTVPFYLMRESNRYDYGVLEYAIRAELLELEEIRWWASDPRLYTSTIASGIASLAEREFAPVADRIAAIGSRLGAASSLLEAARANVANPPRVWTELAIRDANGLIEYVRDGLPAALEAQSEGSTAGLDGIEQARLALADALTEHVAWLENELLPASTGEFRLGQYLFLRKLLYEEHVNLSVEELDRLNEQAIGEYQERVVEVAAQIDSTRSPREIMDSLVADHPTPEALVSTAREMMESARAWVLESDVVTVPDGAVPIVREAPPYARGGFAAMDAPGPFSETGLEAYYTITNVLPSWTEEQKQEHLTYFNYPGLLGVTLHETYPGHYVQLMVERQVESDLRKVFTPRSFTEGWAHYSEQMALDEGFEEGDPGVRLGQLRRALQRHARWYAGLHLHAMSADIDEVVERFMEIAYFDEFPARREVIRATYDPTYLYYALGRMQIIGLRQDYEAYLEEHDQEFSLKAFHDRLLELALPLPLAREALIPSPQTRPGVPQRRPRSGFDD